MYARPMSTRAALVAAAAFAVAGLAFADDAPARAKGPGFSVPIPAGYTNMSGKFPNAAVALAGQRSQPGWFVPSIVVTAIPPSTPPVVPSDVAMCKATAAQLAAITKSSIGRAEIIDGPMGKTCQFEIHNAKQAALGTIVAGKSSMWMVTCNRDPRDAGAIAVCAQTIAAFRFE